MGMSTPFRSRIWLCVSSLAGLLLAALVVPLQAAGPGPGVSPRIPGFGPVFPVAHPVAMPQASGEYKILMDLTRAEPGYDQLNRGLELAARLANLLGLAGVPAAQVHLAVVAHDQALDALLNDATYRSIHGIGNPNAALLQALHRAGVELLVCGQTMAHRHIEASQLAPHVHTALSALTTVILYQQRGYVVLAP